MASYDKNNANRFVAKKCYEIAYAIFRITSNVKSRGLADKMESQAATILEAGYGGSYAPTKTALATAECFLRFCSDIGLLSQSSSEPVIEEIRALNPAIAGLPNETEPVIVSLKDIFSKERYVENRPSKRTSTTEQVPGTDIASITHSEHESSSGNAAIRQSAILERVRQGGDCRLKEIQELLSEASERTLRYDVQNLLEQGLIERVGGGGPATYYRAAEQAPQQ